jgi:anaerobic ribonucleoside-triphosphate reductase
MKNKVVDYATSTHKEFAQAILWKASCCPSCGTKGGWRIGGKWCLNCVEWRSVKKLLKRHTGKTVRSKYYTPNLKGLRDGQ